MLLVKFSPEYWMNFGRSSPKFPRAPGRKSTLSPTSLKNFP